MARHGADPAGRLRILIVMMSSFPGPSPMANHVQRLARGLGQLGHRARVVAPRLPGDGLPADGHDDFGTPYSSFPMPARPRLLPFYPHWTAAIRGRLERKVAEVIAAEGADAVIVYGESWYAFAGVRALCKREGIPLLGYPMEWAPPGVASVLGLSWPDQWMHRHVTYPRCDGIIGISRMWAQWARRQGVPAIVVPSFSKFDENDAPAAAGPEAHQRFRIVFVGRWVRRELPRTLFDAMQRALDRGVDLELVVVGSAGNPTSLSHRIEERPATRRLAKLPRVRERIRFLGFVDPQTLVREMNAADAFVLLRRQSRETDALFPTRLPEYLATGKPVIVSDAGDLAAYLKHGESAYVIPAGDRPAELADAIVRLATHPDEAAAIGRGGRRALAESFDQQKLAARVADFVGSLGRASAQENRTGSVVP